MINIKREPNFLTTEPYFLTFFRMSHARGKAEAAEGVAQRALEECRLARAIAKDLSPSFHHYGNGQ